MIKKCRFSFALIELMIGLSLTALIMGIIFTSLYQHVTVSGKLKNAQKEVFARARLQQRLSKVFGHVNPEKNTFCLTKDNVLMVHFDNGIDLNPAFSRIVLGKLYCLNNSLLFNVEGEENTRTFLLKEGVKAIHFHFLTIENNALVEKETWEKKEGEPPLYIKLTLNEDEHYAFWVNHLPEGIPVKGGKPT